MAEALAVTDRERRKSAAAMEHDFERGLRNRNRESTSREVSLAFPLSVRPKLDPKSNALSGEEWSAGPAHRKKLIQQPRNSSLRDRQTRHLIRLQRVRCGMTSFAKSLLTMGSLSRSCSG